MDIWIRRNGVIKNKNGVEATEEQLADQVNDNRVKIIEYEETIEDAIQSKITSLEMYCNNKITEEFEYKNNLYILTLEFKQNLLGIVTGGQIFESLNGSNTYIKKITSTTVKRIDFTLIEVVEMGLQIAAKIDSYEDRREIQTALIKNKKTIEDVENYDFTL